MPLKGVVHVERISNASGFDKTLQILRFCNLKNFCLSTKRNTLCAKCATEGVFDSEFLSLLSRLNCSSLNPMTVSNSGKIGLKSSRKNYLREGVRAACLLSTIERWFSTVSAICGWFLVVTVSHQFLNWTGPGLWEPSPVQKMS
jgi:hypothetical protein